MLTGNPGLSGFNKDERPKFFNSKPPKVEEEKKEQQPEAPKEEATRKVVDATKYKAKTQEYDSKEVVRD